jgi:hypothetical protein
LYLICILPIARKMHNTNFTPSSPDTLTMVGGGGREERGERREERGERMEEGRDRGVL